MDFTQKFVIFSEIRRCFVCKSEISPADRLCGKTAARKGGRFHGKIVCYLLHIGGGYLIGEDNLLRGGLLLHGIRIRHQLLGQFPVGAQTGAGRD